MEDGTKQTTVESTVVTAPATATAAPAVNAAQRVEVQPIELKSGIKASLIVDYVFWVITAVILLRFAFKLIGALSTNAFVGLIYNFTSPIVDLFKGIVSDVVSGSMVIEFSALIAIAIMWLIYKALLRLIVIANK